MATIVTFNTEYRYDKLMIYDGSTPTSSALLAQLEDFI